MIYKQKPRLLLVKVNNDTIAQHVRVESDKSIRYIIELIANQVGIPKEHVIDYGLIVILNETEKWLSEDVTLASYKFKGQVECWHFNLHLLNFLFYLD